jgi:hypothetical protein
MAGDSDLTVVTAVKNSIVNFSTGYIVAHDTGQAYLDVSTMDGSHVIFLVKHIGAKAGTISVQDGAEYSGGSIGNLKSSATTDTGEYIVGPLETARFKDSDGYIRLFKTTDDTDVFRVRAILIP